MIIDVPTTFRVAAAGVCLAAGLLASTALAQDKISLPTQVTNAFGQPPAITQGPFPGPLLQAVRTAFVDSIATGTWGPNQTAALSTIAASGDARIAWIISDMLRISFGRSVDQQLAEAASTLLATDFGRSNIWGNLTDHLIAWDIPAPPDYLAFKRAIFTQIQPEWDMIFVDNGQMDWRHVSWGGVMMDQRPFDTTDTPCNCIPAADNPQVSVANDAKWLPDDAVVFGIAINGEARAYPRRIMEVREMVNDTLGGRDLGIPYCTLCGAAQAYFTDQLPAGVKRPILRTSGLLIRSNKVMYDITSESVFDTFLGRAVTGPLAKKGLVLHQAPVITTTWGEWKAAYPNTTVLVEALALGRDFDFRNTRDADGPIFPVGDVDPRLPVHEDIIGIVTSGGMPIAFPRAAALLALKNGKSVRFEGVKLVLDAGGIRAVDTDGNALGSHQAFWFAWSQFHPETKLWDR